jgi:predicted transposase YbfD/YdcC
MDEEKKNLLGYLSIVPDPRLNRKKLHLLSDILFISVCASICGCDTWTDIYLFASEHKDWLQQYIPLKNGIPSVDTIARVFSLIDPDKFELAFRAWVASLYTIQEGKIIPIDGKRVRGSYGNGKSAIHMVGAFAAESGLALAQVKTEDKSNEITAIPELLDALVLNGCIITLDAMGCQKAIVEKIVERGGDYVISLKGNQGNLHDDVKLFLETEIKKGFAKTPHDYYETIEKGHGRVETRRYWITDKIDWLANKSDWKKLSSIGLVESECYKEGKITVERRCFINSIVPEAKRFAHAVRQHWTIENNLHWQLDVSFDEDKLRMRAGYAAQNLSTMRRMVLNILKQDETTKASMKAKRKKAGWNKDYLVYLLGKLFNF